MNISNNFVKLKPFIISTVLGLTSVGLIGKIFEYRRRRIIKAEYDYAKAEFDFAKAEFELAKDQYNCANEALEGAIKLYEEAFTARESAKLEFDFVEFIDDEEPLNDKNRATYSTNPAESVKEVKTDEVSGS